MFLLLAADDLPWLPCAGPGMHGHVDLTYLQFLQEPVSPGQHLLAVEGDRNKVNQVPNQVPRSGKISKPGT